MKKLRKIERNRITDRIRKKKKGEEEKTKECNEERKKV